MNDLFTAFYGQVPQLSSTLTVSPPDILGNMTISGSNGMVGQISQGVFGESILQMDGEVVAKVQDSVVGNYDVITSEGTFTAMDNVYGSETLYQFGEAVAIAKPGLFGTENWYDAGTNELLATTGVNGFGQATITLPSGFDTTSLVSMNNFDSFSAGSDLVDFSDAFAGTSDFFDFLDFI